MNVLDFLKKKEEKNRLFKEEQTRRKIHKILDEREKSNNERILEKMMEEERQKKINEQVKKMQEERNRELFSGGMKAEKNMFVGHKSILDSEKNLLTHNNMMNERGMFFQ